MSLLRATATFWETRKGFLYSKCIMIFEMVLSDPFSHEHPECTVTKKVFSISLLQPLCTLPGK